MVVVFDTVIRKSGETEPTFAVHVKDLATAANHTLEAEARNTVVPCRLRAIAKRSRNCCHYAVSLLQAIQTVSRFDQFEIEQEAQSTMMKVNQTDSSTMSITESDMLDCKRYFKSFKEDGMPLDIHSLGIDLRN